MESILLCHIFLEIIFKDKFILETLVNKNENGLKMHFQNGFENLSFWLLWGFILDWSRLQHIWEFNKVSTSSWDENENGIGLEMIQN